MKRRTNELLDAKPGRRILQVGCGTGDDARQIEEMIAPTGSLIAIDKSEAIISEARRRSRERNDSIRFAVGDATDLDLESATFGACRIERTLIHIPDPTAAMNEMVRVSDIHGKLVAYEPDRETYVIDSSYRELTCRLFKYGYGQLQIGWVARHLPTLFKESGLPAYLAYGHGHVSNLLVARWRESVSAPMDCDNVHWPFSALRFLCFRVI